MRLNTKTLYIKVIVLLNLSGNCFTNVSYLVSTIRGLVCDVYPSEKETNRSPILSNKKVFWSQKK